MNGTESHSLASAVMMFNWIEYSVFCSMLLLSLLIGIYFGYFKKQDTVAEYLLGGKKMGVFPVSMSLIFSHVSGISIIGIPSEVYQFGTQYSAVFVSIVALYFISVNFFVPVFFHLQLNSIYEYFELRFSKGTRTLASLVFAFSLMTFIPVVIYVPALAFNQVTGVSVHVITPIVSLVCVFYTSFGGLKAVVWTDTFQSMFTLGSTIFVLILGFLKVGGVSNVFRINEEGSRLELFNLDPNPFERSTFWSVSIGLTFAWLSYMALHPGSSQRFIAVATLKEAKAVTLWACVGYIVVKALTILVGLVLYATYYDCDPVAVKIVQKPGQILPNFVMQVSRDYPGLTGLFISGVLSAALSTMSACLNTVSGTLYEDFVQFVLRGKKQTEAMQAFTLKMIVLIIGIACIALVFVAEKLGSLLQMAISLSGVTNGTLVGLFILGLFFPTANAKGALAGAVSSLATMIVIVFGAQYYMAYGMMKYPGKVTSIDGCPTELIARLDFNASTRVQTYTGVGTPTVIDGSVPLIFQMSYWYYISFGTLVVLLVGLPISHLTGSQDLRSLDPKLITPCVRRFLPQTQICPEKPAPGEYQMVNTELSPEDVKNCL